MSKFTFAPGNALYFYILRSITVGNVALRGRKQRPHNCARDTGESFAPLQTATLHSTQNRNVGPPPKKSLPEMPSRNL